MTPEERDYQEALRRIKEVQENKSAELDLSNLESLTRFPPELARLTSLQTLDLSWCFDLSGDLRPLAELKALQRLDLSWCFDLSGDLSPLAELKALQRLDLSWCFDLSGDLSPLAGLASLQSLKLTGCDQLSGDLSPLAKLTSLQELDLTGCEQLSGDLSPLAKLTSLQELDLTGCDQLSCDLSPLAELTSLQSLDLSECRQFSEFAPLEPLLARLEKLDLYDCRFDDLPSEVCVGQNVIREVRAHFDDLKAGRALDAELKVFILGNGGKTQLARRLRDLNYDPEIPTTHGIELNFIQTNVDLEHFKGPVRLNLWDFGGQDIYHGAPITLFLHGQAIFLLLWKKEEATDKADSKHQPITYWLDYLRAVAGPDNPLIVCQSQCDSPEMRASVPVSLSAWVRPPWVMEASAKTDFGLPRLKATLQEAAWACLHNRPPPIGTGRLKVRDRLREMLAKDQELPPTERHRLLEREAFDQLCAEIGGISDTEALLGFLHHNGVVFYSAGLFKNQIIFDQNWALEAIYSIFHQDKCFKQLKKLYGRFSREDLELLIWSSYAPEEQKVFLGMMESCGICFRVRALQNYEWEYIAPELLPEWSEAQTSLLAGRIPKDHPMAEAQATYTFLHEGVLRSYLSRIGQQAGDAAIYWKYGCWSYEETTDSRVLIEGGWHDAESQAGPGTIRLRAWGQNAESLIDPLLEALQSLPVGQPPEIKRIKAIGAHATSLSSASVTVRLVSALPLAQPPDIIRQDGSKQLDRPAQIKLEDLIFARDPFMKDFFISYTKTDQAWAEWIAWTLEAAGYSTVIQVWDFLPGSNFVLEMQRAATEANRTIAVLSQKYLESAFTQPEWAAAFAQDPQGKKQKLIPIRIEACQLTGLPASIVYLDLVGLPESDARTALLGAFSVRNKPAAAPAFPSSVPPIPRVSPPQPVYPGTIHATSTSTAKILVNLVEGADQSRRLSAAQRLQFMRQLNEIVPQHFNMLLFAVNPPAGFVPPMPAAQADRTSALLTWAEAPGGCGLSVLQQLLETILNPQ